MEIIRNVWQKDVFFDNVKIIHSFNGKKEWYPERYLEDYLITTKNTWHFQGASDLIDVGIKKFKNDVDYVIILAADTWLINPNYLKDIINKMDKEGLLLTTCAWGVAEKNDIKDVGMAVDFFIVNLKWARKYKMFPVNYGEFYKKYGELFLYKNGGNVMLEKLTLMRFMTAIAREQKFGGSARKRAFERIFILKDREPVHSHINGDGNWERKMYWPEMGLLTHHEVAPKKEIFKENKINEGYNIEKLLESDDLEYFNNGFTKGKYSAN